MTIAQYCKTAIAVAAFVAASSALATTMSKAEFSAAKDRISADYRADKSSCATLSGNAKDVCREEAKGKDKIALAELQYRQSGKASDSNKVDVAKAEATYAVAKEMCDDKAGDTKEVCVTEARAGRTKALADSTLNKKIGEATKDAAEDKRDADYKVAAEKCEGLAGETKAACVTAAKSRFNKN